MHFVFEEVHHLVNDQQVGDGFSVGTHHITSLFHRLRQDLLNLLGNNSCRRTEHAKDFIFTASKTKYERNKIHTAENRSNIEAMIEDIANGAMQARSLPASL